MLPYVYNPPATFYFADKCIGLSYLYNFLEKHLQADVVFQATYFQIFYFTTRDTS